MRRAAWIAADLIKDAAGSGPFIVMGLFLGLWLPLQAGLIDGVNARFPLLPPMRLSLVMSASWPALAVLGLHAQVLFPRRLRHELEPLLASPATDFEIVAGLALPAAAPLALSAPLVYGLSLAGYRTTAGRLPDGIAGEFGLMALAAPAACLWLTAFAVDASLRARSQGAFVLRVAAGYFVLAAIDLAHLGLAVCGLRAFIAPMLALSLAAGAAALARVPSRLDREALIERI